MVLFKTLIFVCVYFVYVQGFMTDEEVRVEFTKILMRCTKTNPVEISELFNLHSLKVPTDKNSKCLLACTYKEAKVINEKGEFDLAANYKIAETSKEGNKKDIENAKKFADFCSKVNEVKVNDGENGCERAALIFKCIVENATKFGFKA